MADGAVGFREVRLPSLGVLYEGKIPGGVIKLRPMTVADEKLMFSSKATPAAVFDDIIEHCLLTKDLALADYLLGDKYFMLSMLRFDSYGSTYTYKFTCPACGVKQEAEMELAQCLKVNPLNEDFKEPLECKLPMSGRVIGYRLLRVSDEREFDRVAKDAKLRGKDPLAELYSFVRARRILSIDGVSITLGEALGFCNNMFPGDGQVFDSDYSSHECIPDFSGEVECQAPSCATIVPFIFKMNSEFFRAGHFGGARVG
jgi:hypothetical protein